eukprot:2100151-Lingulodinium_polyedra.AAC.1
MRPPCSRRATAAQPLRVRARARERRAYIARSPLFSARAGRSRSASARAGVVVACVCAYESAAFAK